MQIPIQPKIFIIFFLVGFFTSLGVKHNFIRVNFLPGILICIYAVSLLPALTIPYIIDDVDHLFALSKAIDSNQVLTWLFTPHNEHVIPSIKTIYYLSYKYFWLFPDMFHLMIILVWSGILYITGRLLFHFTHSKHSTLIGCSLLASTNLPDLAIFVITNSHIVICLFFFLLMFYSQLKYATSGRFVWLWTLILSILLAPTTFSLGTTTILFAFLFEKLCIPQDSGNQKKGTMLIIFASWALGLVPYLVSMDQIFLARHYQDLTSTSSFEIANIPRAIQYLVLYVYHDLIPNFLPDPYFSMGIFFLVVFSGVKYKEIIDWKKIFVFFSLGIFLTLIVYTFRIAWGPKILGVSRYDVFPCLMLCMIYGLIIHAYLQRNTWIIENSKYLFILHLLCFFLVSYSGAIRYGRAEKIASETEISMQQFNVKCYNAFNDYFKDNNPSKPVEVKDELLLAPPIPSLISPKGLVPNISRYHRRRLSFYAQYILPQNIRERIVWGDSTDEDILNYLETHNDQEQYSSMLHIIR